MTLQQFSQVFRGKRGVRASILLVGTTAASSLNLLFSHSLLNDPNTSSPANVEASNLYKDNRREYTKRVRETVEKSWDD